MRQERKGKWGIWFTEKKITRVRKLLKESEEKYVKKKRSGIKKDGNEARQKKETHERE